MRMMPFAAPWPPSTRPSDPKLNHLIILIFMPAIRSCRPFNPHPLLLQLRHCCPVPLPPLCRYGSRQCPTLGIVSSSKMQFPLHPSGITRHPHSTSITRRIRRTSSSIRQCPTIKWPTNYRANPKGKTTKEMQRDVEEVVVLMRVFQVVVVMVVLLAVPVHRPWSVSGVILLGNPNELATDRIPVKVIVLCP